MSEKYYTPGKWEYRYVCKSCGNICKEPENRAPCKYCGGTYSGRVSMRKIYLEPPRKEQFVNVEVPIPKTFWEKVREFFGFPVEERYTIEPKKLQDDRKWRWQTAAELEEQSGVMRHEDYL